MKSLRVVAVAAIAVLIGAGGASAQMGRTFGTGGGGSNSAMVEHGGKLYVVSGTTLARIDAKTLKVEAKQDLSSLGKTAEDEEADKKRRQEYLDRFDKNNDGEIGEDEFGRSWYLKRRDANQDGKITEDELSFLNRKAPGASGDVELLIKPGTLYMLRAGVLFAFDLATLKLKDTTRIEEQKAAPARQRPGGQRPGGRDGRDGGDGGGGGDENAF